MHASVTEYLTPQQRETLALLPISRADAVKTMAVNKMTAASRLHRVKVDGFAVTPQRGWYELTERGQIALATWPVILNPSRFAHAGRLVAAHAVQGSPEFRLAISRGRRQPPRTACKVLKTMLDALNGADMTDAQLAKKLGYCSATIGHWRHGVAAPRAIDLEALAEVLGGEIVFRMKESDGAEGQ